jgi:soluble lytic murein transglycosylase-like protein
MIVNGIGSTEDTYYSNNKTVSTQANDFDSTYEAATSVYALPESNGKQSSIGSSSSGVTAPSDLESIFKKASDTYGVSEDLLKAVAKAESNFNTNSTSSAGAMGVMQLMPSTAAQLGVTDAYDAEQNIMGGAKLLSQLLNKYDGDTSLALAAYNAGSGNVDKYGGIPPFTETQNYVNKILGYLNDGNIEVPNTAYASSDSSDVTTIYAVAASDASNNGPSIFTINAEPLL